MENLSEADANILQTFGPGQGLVSGQAVRFPLLVKVKFDQELVSKAIGDEDFIAEARAWKPDPRRKLNTEIMEKYRPRPSRTTTKTSSKAKIPKPAPPRLKKNTGRRRAIDPDY
jgi:hypothetical protein